MIKVGIVSSVSKFASKSIVSFRLLVAYDDLNFTDAVVVFSGIDNELKLDGCKWWCDDNEVDFLFNNMKELPEIGVTVYVK